MEKQECTYKCPNRRRCKILTELVCEYKKCTFFKPVNHDAGGSESGCEYENGCGNASDCGSENGCADESGCGSGSGGESDSGCAVNESDKNMCKESKRDVSGCEYECVGESGYGIESRCGSKNEGGYRSEDAGFSDG